MRPKVSLNYSSHTISFFTVNNIVYCKKKKRYSMIGNQLLRTFLHFKCVKFQLTFSVSVCLSDFFKNFILLILNVYAVNVFYDTCCCNA